MFNKVRQWGKIRSLGSVKPEVQYQKVLEEIVEIHDALVTDNRAELIDAIGDSVISLTNFAKTLDLNIEDCTKVAFDVIEKRKGFTTKNGQFIRYGKLDTYDKKLCDVRQGNPGNEYYIDEPTKEDFQWPSN